ncbi:MAG: ArsR family transcriptional regulator [Candidatus Hecatellales archaeon B24]|nr:MAG: ArsR family transcriptional regulator [Candidatus Hecatellales archaeon B24]
MELMNGKHTLMEYRVNLLKALANPARLEIIEFLRDGEKCVCEIIPALGKAQSTASKHLDILYEAGILDRRIDGKRTLYRIKNPQIFRLLGILDRLILDRFSSFVKAVEVLKAKG